MKYDFLFSPEERENLTITLYGLSKYPYTDYQAYMNGVRGLAEAFRVPARIVVFCTVMRSRDFEHIPIFVLGNCPIMEMTNANIMMS